MIVYGDRAERACPPARIAQLVATLDAVAAMPAGIARHGALCGAFITLGQVVQGVADADRERIGADGASAAEQALLSPLGLLAGALLASWQSGFADGDVAGAAALLRAAGDSPLPDEVELRVAEGYAFYAVYPEGFAEAARRLVLAGPPRVIGIRSIGTGLAALVAQALGAPLPLTVRPIGHPFDRHILLAPDAAAASIDPSSHYVVVDEGPGLSGSSFAAVADYLERHGIARSRIAFLPSHAGDPGTQASASIRARWASAQRPVTSFDTLVPPDRLAHWAESLLGPIDRLPADISGGGWRHHLYASEAAWPAVHAWQERRKLLVDAAGERWLLKFAGLGEEGTRKLARARILHAAGLIPEVRGIVHGFLVQRWVDAVPLTRAAAKLPDAAARYLGARARLLPPPGSGASLAELLAMARHNIALALGEGAAARFAEAHAQASAMESQVVRIATDNRCDPHEWLRLPDGRILKADALDHDAAHDLIGAQDLAWDVAGTAAEFDLDEDATGQLVAATERAAGRVIDRALLGFLLPCYCAFRLGAAQLAADGLGGWPAEQARNRAAVARYSARLARLIG